MRRRGRWRCRQLLAVALLVALLWVAGFVDFLGRIPAPDEHDGGSADAIVVLTGGAERVREGLRLLLDGRAPLVFVSGVHPDATLAEMLAFVPEYQGDAAAAEAFACCVVLGREAGNTAGNARETAVWLAKEKLRSVLLVTADYHMPRSLLEFRRALPGATIIPHAVFPEESVREVWWRQPRLFARIFVEYHKYLFALVRSLVAGRAATA